MDEIPTILRRYEELQSGRTAGWTCAVGLVSLVRAIHDESDQVFPCSVVLDGEYGRAGLSMGVPVVLGRRGVREIKQWKLAADEWAAFERSAEAMAAAARIVDERLSARRPSRPGAGRAGSPRLAAGADVSYSLDGSCAWAAAVVLDRRMRVRRPGRMLKDEGRLQ